MSLHKEIEFENDIRAHLAGDGWLCAAGDAAGHVRMLALFPADVLACVQAAQSDSRETLSKNHRAFEKAVMPDHIRKQPDDCGTLDLRRFVEVMHIFCAHRPT